MNAVVDLSPVVDESRNERSGRLVAGRFRLRSLLGRGAMGRVWLADDELLDRPIALKQHLSRRTGSVASDRSARARSLTEARTAGRVTHSGVVRILDLVRDGSMPWIVMELLSGRTLAETVAADGPLSIDRTTGVALRLLDALSTVHAAGIVHCDVKPGNVQLCSDGRVVLTDFGIARSNDDDFECPPGALAGSPAFMAPEQHRGEPPAPAADLFSLGATLYAAVEGRTPFDKGDLRTTLTAVAEDPPGPWLRAGRLRPVIAGLLAKDPAERLTASAARDALLAL